MIVFDLKCGQEHVFEAWFADSGGFDSQVADGEVDNHYQHAKQRVAVKAAEPNEEGIIVFASPKKKAR